MCLNTWSLVCLAVLEGYRTFTRWSLAGGSGSLGAGLEVPTAGLDFLSAALLLDCICNMTTCLMLLHQAFQTMLDSYNKAFLLYAIFVGYFHWQ